MKFTFLLPVASDARCIKRINALQEEGAVAQILAFEREYYPGKISFAAYKTLGSLHHGQYHKRMIPFLNALPIVRAFIKNSDVVYAFGLDVLLLVWLASRGIGKQVKIVYEVADIRGILLGETVVSCCLRWIERFLIRRTDLLVVTSKAYITGYYYGIQRLKNIRYMVIENKLDEKAVPASSPIANGEKDVIRIGYFGLIRCHRSWEVLKKVAERGGGRFKVYVRGIPMGLDHLEDEARDIPNINYGGPFVSPDDLPMMYGKVDIVWACYPYQSSEIGNWRWARANRFYEACFFKKPMIAQSGTEDGRVVEDLELGMCLDLTDIEGSVNQIMSITDEQLLQWQHNITHLPQSIYTYTNEHQQLYEWLNNDCKRIGSK